MTAESQPNVAPHPRKRRPAVGGAEGSGPYYILAASPVADDRSRVLKHGETFAVFDHHGDIKPVGLSEEGIYHEGTRFLSCLTLRLGQDRPLFLSSTIREGNDLLAVDLTNPDIFIEGRLAVPRGALHIARSEFLWQGACYDRLRVRNYGLAPMTAVFVFEFDADFVDIFEVRGTQRKKRGRFLDPIMGENTVVLGYEGLDGVVRRTRLVWSPAPAALSEDEARFEVSLPPQSAAVLELTVACEAAQPAAYLLPCADALAASGNALEAARVGACNVHTSNEQFNDWLRRTEADLYMMTTAMPTGPYPYAGVPWFSTPFGRDGIITALQCLWLDPGMARGVLAFLAATQATEAVSTQDAEPGKILHETRSGEMAALGEIPFGRYYGSVDSTPLFVLLAGEYFQRTGDRAFLESIWPNVEAALRWIDTYGDSDRDGFVEYSRRSPDGLVQQGWKDSHDSVFHEDGTLAQAPIALCEVQGYVYAARKSAAAVAEALDRHDRAEGLRRQAAELQEKFEKAFWCEKLGIYALALDGEKRPCRVRTSNAGQCLFTGIASAERGRRVGTGLLSEACFSGWGVRTVASTEVRYNPMSYHNGSIWPHDNALIAEGLARYGLKGAAMQLLTGLFDASIFLDFHRLPELFCGFERRPGEGPTLYPVACAPQAWASASIYMLLQACLGLRIDAGKSQVSFSYPQLPPSLKEVQIKNLRVGGASVDMLVVRYGQDVGINVLRREGQVEIRMVK